MQKYAIATDFKVPVFLSTHSNKLYSQVSEMLKMYTENWIAEKCSA
jgi:hypothetical protein